MKITINNGGYKRHEELLKTRLEERIPVEYEDGGMNISLVIDESIESEESYEIKYEENKWSIIGSDKLGLSFGIGKFLHSAKWTDKDFSPQKTDKLMIPDCSFRMIYASAHFSNFYMQAPDEEISRYIEDLMLYGYNTVLGLLPAPSPVFKDDGKTEKPAERAMKYLKHAKELGLRIVGSIHPNQGKIDAPHEFDADQSRLICKNGRNLCLKKPGALDYMRSLWTDKCKLYKEIGADYIIMWPYDEGGCTCEKCYPWGSNGFCDGCKLIRDEVIKYIPDAKFIVSTWCFDYVEGLNEYKDFYKRLKGDMSWVDYIMVDSHDEFPKYPLEHEVIKPIINFPEISMWRLAPWGAFGANPLPERFQGFWDNSKHIIDGGMPYSEGIYEDISKVQWAGYYWSKDSNWRDILAEYVNYELDASVCDDVLELFSLIEKNHVRVGNYEEPDLEVAKKAKELADSINARLSERAKNSWRWYLIYIRAILDIKRYTQHSERKDETLTIIKRYRLGETKHYREVKDDERLIVYSAQYLKDDEEAQSIFRRLREMYHCEEYYGMNNATLPPLGNVISFDAFDGRESK